MRKNGTTTMRDLVSEAAMAKALGSEVIKIRTADGNHFYGIRVGELFYAGERYGKPIFGEYASSTWDVAQRESEAEAFRAIAKLEVCVASGNYTKIKNERFKAGFKRVDINRD